MAIRYPSGITVEPRITEALERWQQCEEAEASQRAAMLVAKQFRAGEQWPAEIKIQRSGASALQGQAAQPPRPSLTIDRLSQPIRQVSNLVRSANFAIDVTPNGFGADDNTAKFYKGILKRIQAVARDDSPIDWAADGAAEAGLGWFRIRTEYVPVPEGHAGPEVFDQDILLERIPNSMSVYCDPTATKPTKGDARFQFVTDDLDREEFKRRWPKAKVASADLFAAVGDRKLQEWSTQNVIRIAEYWHVDDEEVVYLFDEGQVSVAGKDTTPSKTAKRRVVKRPIVTCDIISAIEVLESYTWLGSRIPLIPILGEELNVDGKRLYRGMISESSLEAQRMINFMYSAAVEAVALSPKAPFLIAEGQLESYEKYWQHANTFNYSYLPYRPISVAGTLVPPPQRQVSEPPIQAIVEMLAKSEDAIKATTGIFDPSLGMPQSNEQSGKAVQAWQRQAELGHSNYLDNVSRAIIYAGEMLVELIPKIYDRPGRIIHLIGEDDAVEPALIKQPFQVQKGTLQPMGPPGQPPTPPPPGQEDLQASLTKFYDPSQGQYAVTVTVGKSYSTQREEGTNILGQLLPNLPPEMAASITPTYIRQLGFPGAEGIAAQAEKVLPPGLQPDGEQSPQALQAKLAQMMQQGQQMGQELQKLQMIVQTKQIETDNEYRVAQYKASIELQKAEIAAAASMANAQAKVDAENFRSYVDALETRIAKVEGLHLEHALTAKDQVHEHVQGTLDRAHEVAMSALEHQQALEQAAHAASIAPKPTSNGSSSEGTA